MKNRLISILITNKIIIHIFHLELFINIIIKMLETLIFNYKIMQTSNA
jgi:hypothetical protein